MTWVLEFIRYAMIGFALCAGVLAAFLILPVRQKKTDDHFDELIKYWNRVEDRMCEQLNEVRRIADTLQGSPKWNTKE